MSRAPMYTLKGTVLQPPNSRLAQPIRRQVRCRDVFWLPLHYAGNNVSRTSDGMVSSVNDRALAPRS